MKKAQRATVDSFTTGIKDLNTVELLDMMVAVNRAIADRANQIMIDNIDNPDADDYEYSVQAYRDAAKAADEALRTGLMLSNDLL